MICLINLTNMLTKNVKGDVCGRDGTIEASQEVTAESR